MFAPNRHPHCHVCCFKLFFLLCGLFGLTPYNIDCKTSEKLRISKPLFFLSITSFAYYVLIAIHFVTFLKYTRADHFLFMILTSYAILDFNAAISVFMCLRKIDANTTVLKGYFRCLETILLRNCNLSLYKSSMKNLYWKNVAYGSGFFLIVLYAFLMYFLTQAHIYFLAMFLVLQFYTDFLYLALQADIHGAVLKLADDSVKSLLSRQLGANPKIFNKYLSRNLSELHKVRIELYLNSKLWAEYYSPAMAIMAVAFFMAGVLYYYLLIKLFPDYLVRNGNQFLSYYIFGDIALASAVLSVVVLDGLASSGEDLEGYLFRYPISKLHPKLRFQIENIILALDYCKPMMTPSDVATMSRSLMSSFIHTLITYTLTLIQYYDAYLQE